MVNALSNFDLIVLKNIKLYNTLNQRLLSNITGISLGKVNDSLSNLKNNGYIVDSKFTEKANLLFCNLRPVKAVILAAGFGMRMVPINTIRPKALMEVNGEVLIERQIRQLHEVGIYDITIVVGFMKECFDYLIDEFNVKLIYNPDYAIKNNLYSLNCAINNLDNAYIIPSDVWCFNNPFSSVETYSWYMVSEKRNEKSEVIVNRKNELVKSHDDMGNRMIGVAYISKYDTEKVISLIKKAINNSNNDSCFWEDLMYEKDKMIFSANVVKSDLYYEIDTYEQLLELDSNSSSLNTLAIDIICDIFDTTKDNITNIKVLKKGMTNRSFLFEVNSNKYIMRIPGEGTDLLINRQEEADVYKAICGLGFCDDPIYLNPENGYKITKYLPNVRVCDASSQKDLKECIALLKRFHEKKLAVNHEFNIIDKMSFYESLWNGNMSIYRDYETTKKNILKLSEYVNSLPKEKILTHIDANCDNFLYSDGEINLQLTDWEYAGMCDPDVDIAMFAIYSAYDRKKIDNLINIYYENDCDKTTRIKIYCYIAMCGLLWSNWCEYKRNLGVEFGEYSLIQYRYAKDFYKIVQEELKND